MKTPVPTLTVPQYCLLRSLVKTGIPAELAEIFLGRCGASVDDWQFLLAQGWVAPGKRADKGRFVLTDAGKRVYQRRPRNVYF